mmetsp:Transcript_25511/g.58886  ORF Transcript_25511/g.58886 Transcript_25511/m.58886 type:complete len:780 (-) Transcript_25511:105-2444(-)
MAEEAASGATESPQLLIPGQVIQNYEIQKPLGKGKFSVVYMAKRLSDEVMVALKKINIFDMMVPKQREKCMKEVRLLQSLDHPNIVKLLDSFVDSSELLIIVEWAEKGDLKRLIRKAMQNEVMFKQLEIWEYARQLSSALDHMHKKRIMHRDLKPANIFVAQDNSLKLGDLGLGRFFSSHTLEAFSKVGTPLYMSPEVLKGAGYDMRSDVWSLGCVLYELCVLRSPFKSDKQLSLYDLFVRINKGQYAPLPEIVAAEFRELVSYMLQLDPAHRADSWQVLEVCTQQVVAIGTDAHSAAGGTTSASQAHNQPRVRPSPLLVMDDIVEKLKLLECDERCFRRFRYPTLHRCFFVEPLPPTQRERVSQFEVMYELMLWLLGMLKAREERKATLGADMVSAAAAADASAGPCLLQEPRTLDMCAEVCQLVQNEPSKLSSVGAGDAAAGYAPEQKPVGKAERTRYAKEDIPKLVQGLLQNLAQRGIQITSEASLAQLHQGYGEGVCLVLNELINQELVARDFHFAVPKWAEHEEEEVVEELDGDSVSEINEAAPTVLNKEVEADGEEHLPVYHHGQLEGAVDDCSSTSLLEPIHWSTIDPEAWAAELAKVTPMLKVRKPHEDSDWRQGASMVRQFHKQMLDDDTLGRVPKELQAYSLQLQEDLRRVHLQEDRINTKLSADGQVHELRTTSMEAAQSMESVTLMHERLTELSHRHDAVDKELAQVKAQVQDKSEAVQESDAVAHLRRACRRLRDDSTALAVKMRLVEADIADRHKQREAQKRSRR